MINETDPLPLFKSVVACRPPEISRSPFHTRVIQVVYEWAPAERWRTDRTRIVAVILYPPEVKRQLATLEAASARALELAR
jgi:hypothetical protein